MRGVKATRTYTEYMIEYDTENRVIWVSGLTPEGFWDDFEILNNTPYTSVKYINVKEDALEIAREYRLDGEYVTVVDVTGLDDIYHDDEIVD